MYSDLSDLSQEFTQKMIKLPFDLFSLRNINYYPFKYELLNDEKSMILSDNAHATEGFITST